MDFGPGQPWFLTGPNGDGCGERGIARALPRADSDGLRVLLKVRALVVAAAIRSFYVQSLLKQRNVNVNRSFCRRVNVSAALLIGRKEDRDCYLLYYYYLTKTEPLCPPMLLRFS